MPLSLLIGEKVGWRGVAGVMLGVAGIVVLADPPRFDWSDKGVVWGHFWLLLSGFTWAIAIVHIRHHRWRTTPLDVLPWQMSVAAVATLADRLLLLGTQRPSRRRPEGSSGSRLIGIGAFAGLDRHLGRRLPRRRHEAPCRQVVASSMAMLGVRSSSIASVLVVLEDEPITLALAIRTALVIAGIAVVILEKSKAAR